MMAICNEAARRQHLKSNPDADRFDEPLSADYCYERVALAPDPLKGFIVREKKGAKRPPGLRPVPRVLWAGEITGLRFAGSRGLVRIVWE